MIDWKYEHAPFAKIEDDKGISFAGAPCVGGYRLRVECDVQLFAFPADRQVYAFSAMGRLTSAYGEIGLVAPDERVSLMTAATGGKGRLSLAVDLDLRRLLALDRLRSEHDALAVTLTTWGLANGVNGVKDFFGNHQAKITQEQWLRVLKDSAYAETVLIDVVAPRDSTEPRQQAAVASLGKAVQRLRRSGEETTAAGDCRLAIDKLKDRFAPPKLPGLTREVRASLLKQIEKLPVGERIALLKFALRHVTHLPHHDDERAFTRPQAELIVQVTAACLAYELKM